MGGLGADRVEKWRRRRDGEVLFSFLKSQLSAVAVINSKEKSSA